MTARSSGRDRVQARALARKLLVQALYQWQIARQPVAELVAQYESTPEFASVDRDYFRTALAAICADSAGLDTELARHSDIEPARLDPVEHAVLVLGLRELQPRPEVPYRVVINEGVELAKRFGATDGHNFVNAVLDRASRTHRERRARRGA